MNERVLIVDDNEDVRRILACALRWQASRSSARPTVARVWRAARRQLGLVLLDLVMPELDGFEFLAALQGDREARRRSW
jgi:CheY-like chemotaxis protein